MPVTTLVNKSDSIIKAIEADKVSEVPKLKDDDFTRAKGSYTFENYTQRRYEQELFLSEPIVVEGQIFTMSLYPNGWDDGKGTHISFGIHRTRLPCMTKDLSEKYWTVRKMLHRSDPLKNYEYKIHQDWTGKGNTNFVTL